jgi:hypothetical protein
MLMLMPWVDKEEARHEGGFIVAIGKPYLVCLVVLLLTPPPKLGLD